MSNLPVVKINILIFIFRKVFQFFCLFSFLLLTATLVFLSRGMYFGNVTNGLHFTNSTCAWTFPLTTVTGEVIVIAVLATFFSLSSWKSLDSWNLLFDCNVTVDGIKSKSQEKHVKLSSNFNSLFISRNELFQLFQLTLLSLLTVPSLLLFKRSY